MQHSSYTYDISYISAVLRLFRRCVAAVCDQILEDRDQWFLWTPVLIATGIGTFFLLPADPSPAQTIAPLMTVCAGLAFTPRYSVRRIIMTAIMCLSLGFAAAGVSSRISGTPPIEKRLVLIDATGIVTRIQPARNTTRFRLHDVRQSDGQKITGGAIDLIVSNKFIDREVRYRRVIFNARIEPPDPPDIPGGYDPQRRAWFDGISASGFAWRFEAAEGPVAGGADIDRVRLYIATALRSSLPERTAEIAVALTIGERRGIHQSDIEILRVSGLAHLLAISGLHIGLVAGMTFFVLRAVMALSAFITLRYPIKKLAAAAALPVAFLYMLLAGATVPTQRAFIMTAIVLLAVLADRRAISLRLVAIAAIGILLTTPYALTGASFQMSFAAVTLIIAVYEQASDRFRSRFHSGRDMSLIRQSASRVASTLGTTLISTLAAGIATAPFAAYHFGQFALYGLLANILAVPLAAYTVMPALLLFVLLLPFGVADPVAGIAGWGIAQILDWAEFVAGLPNAALDGLFLPHSSLILISTGGLWLLIWRRPLRFAGLFPLGLAIILIIMREQPDLMVERTGKWIAVRLSDQSVEIAGTRHIGDFTRRKLDISLGHQPGSPELRCDVIGCRVRLGPHQISYAISGHALAEDCRQPGILISREPAPRNCLGPDIVIDRFDLWRYGAHAITLSGAGPSIETVHDHQGCRAWSRLPACRPRKRQ
ncbi:MAG: ComEC/Rec2 family competence protein [Rhodospirillales bacterium]